MTFGSHVICQEYWRALGYVHLMGSQNEPFFTVSWWFLVAYDIFVKTWIQENGCGFNFGSIWSLFAIFDIFVPCARAAAMKIFLFFRKNIELSTLASFRIGISGIRATFDALSRGNTHFYHFSWKIKKKVQKRKTVINTIKHVRTCGALLIVLGTFFRVFIGLFFYTCWSLWKNN